MVYTNLSSSLDEYLQSPVRHIDAYIKHSKADGSGTFTYKPTDKLISFTLDRIGESSRFFGFGVSQKLNVKLIDNDRTVDIQAGDQLIVDMLGEETISGIRRYYNFFTYFYVTEVHRDENTNQLSVTAYDPLSKLDKYTVADLKLPTVERAVVLEDGTTAVDENGNTIMETVYSYSLDEFAKRCANILRFGDAEASNIRLYKVLYSNGEEGRLDESILNPAPNFEGTELLKQALDALAETLTSIYFFNQDGYLAFKTLPNTSIDGGSYAFKTTINRNQYFTFDSGDNRRLTKLVYTTALGDNIEYDTGISGTTQYIKDNPFYFAYDDTVIGTKLHNSLVKYSEIRMNQFEMSWRGNYNIQIGDLMKVEDKSGEYVTCYLLDDTIEFNGALNQKTRWKYEDVGEDITGNPTTIGEKLNQTFAKVDKVNKQIDIVASDVQANREEIGAIKVNTDNIALSVESIEKNLSESTETINGQIEEIKKKTELAMTPEDVTISVKETLKTGVEEVTTETGFTFNNEGLTIDKSDSEMKTQITEDGMVVYKNDEAMLTANNTGVYAQNLHATTYLIVGQCSRFEDYEKDGEARTGCFWLGGN